MMPAFPLSQQHSSIRKPAVAGQFYSDNPTVIKKQIETFLHLSKLSAQKTHVLICPHAGYVFSGPVAALGYARLDKKVTTVICIGPSHHAWFSGVSIADVDSFQTPLGTIPLNNKIIAELRQNKLVHSVPQADGPEHSIEVQLPFLQIVLPSFTLIPIVTGKVDPAAVADLILPYINDQCAVIASSDLSHYQSNAVARDIDDATIRTILSGNTEGAMDACGETPIRIIMHVAKKLGLKAELVDKRTSFDIAPEFGDEGRVVGYAAIEFVKK